jgi:hypothetical protein
LPKGCRLELVTGLRTLVYVYVRIIAWVLCA